MLLFLLFHVTTLIASDTLDGFWNNWSCEEIQREIDAIKSPSRLAKYYFALGVCYEKKGNIQKAYPAFINAYAGYGYALTPDELFYIAQFFQRQKNENRLLDVIRFTVNKYPRYQPAQLFLEKYNFDLALKQKQDEIDHYKELLSASQTVATQTQDEEEKPSKPDCKTIEAQIIAAQTVKNTKRLGFLYHDLGRCYEDNQQPKQAASAYEKAVSFLSPLPEEEKMHMAIFLGLAGKEKIAIVQLREVLKLNPRNTKAQIYLAKFLNWSGKKEDRQEASSLIDQALQSEPNNMDALLVKGSVLNASEHPLEAADIFMSLLNRKVPIDMEKQFVAKTGLVAAYINLNELTSAEDLLAQLEAKAAWEQKEIDDLAYLIKEKKAEKEKAKTEKEEEKKREEEEKKAFVEERIENAASLTQKHLFEAAYWEHYQALKKDSTNLAAWIALANTLTADGRYCEAYQALNHVLCRKWEEVNAWIALGGLWLAWQNIPGGTAAYLQALALKPDSFDASMGLGWSAFSWDERVLAYNRVKYLQPEKEQRKELCDFLYNIVLGPIAIFDYIHFKDSDLIVTDDCLFDVAYYCPGWRIDGFYHRVWATQPVDLSIDLSIHEYVDALRLWAIKFISPCWDLGGGIGYAHTKEGDFLTGEGKANIRTPCGILNVGSIYDLYTWTAAAIFFRIRTWRNFISYSKVISGRWLAGGDYEYVLYSDSNRANKGDLYLRYTLLPGFYGNIYLNYIVTYWNFDKQILTPFVVPGTLGGHGYFDPQNFFENQLGLTVEKNTKKFELYLHPFLAYLTYNQQGIHNGVYYVAQASATYKHTNKLSLGAGFQAGKYPLKNVRYWYTQAELHFKVAY